MGEPCPPPPHREGRDAGEPDLLAGERHAAVPRHRGLRGHRHPAARERAARPPQLHLAGPARPGEEPDPAPARHVAGSGSEVNDDPFRPISKYGRELIAEQGDDTPVAWLPRDARFIEKLATPDVTIADIIGDVDPIKAARGGHLLSDELTMQFGLLPRANRAIFAVNELPDLAGKVQVGLFNIMQEGDVQIKGYPVRLNLDVALVF